MTYSMVTLTGTFIGIVMCMGGTLIASLSKRKRAGGITFGLYMFASIMMMITNIAWVFVSDSAFVNLQANAWYPYPSLNIGWYMHTVGYLMLGGSNVAYGFVVLPMVWAFDPVEAKLKKVQKRYDKKL